MTSITTNKVNTNHNYNNISNISEKYSDGNRYMNNDDERSMYTPTELDIKNKDNKDMEYTQLQNRKFIFIII